MKTLIRPYFYSCLKSSTSRAGSGSLVCWKCSSPITDRPGVFCSFCNVIQPVRVGQNFFDYFGLKNDFSIDQEGLKNKFRMLQSVVHPDKFGLHTEEEKKYADIHSSFANQAYKTLSNPKTRAVYMLELSNTDEGVTDPEFAMEMLEMNEAIEETSDQKILEQKLTIIQQKVDELMDEISKNFEKGKNEEARDALNRMRYFERTVKLIRKKLGN